MVRLFDTTGDYALTVTGTETAVDGWYIKCKEWSKQVIKIETKVEKRTRLALEKNRASWVQFNELKPRIKQVFKPRNFNHRKT